MYRSCRNLPIILVAGFLIFATACGPGESPPAGAKKALPAPGLGIALGSVPVAFRVASTATDRLVLVPADPKLGGSLTIAAEAPDTGLNLQEAVKRHRKEIEARPDGTYVGATELSGAMGTAYWSRGRYRSAVGKLEETRIVTLDPSQKRILDLTYVYPAGTDSRERVTALLDVVSEIEAYQPPTSGSGADG